MKSRRHRGFTLIELLVVITIVALLASLLLPALSRAKTAAYSAKCKGNLRQLMLGMRLYVDDFQAYPPFRTSSLYLSNALEGYLRQGVARDHRGQTNPAGVFRCPSPAVFKNALYGVNFWGVGEEAEGLGIGGKSLRDPGSGSYRVPTTESAVQIPSDMIAIGDSYVAFVKGAIDDGGIGILARNFTSIASPFPPEAIAESVRIQSRRHGGMANAAFCDGHVDGLRFQPLFFDENDAALRRWHIDHEPHRERLR